MFFYSHLTNKSKNIIDLAAQKNIKIATAESCTGGLLSALFTEISGASQVFERGFVVYANCAKEEVLGVSAKTLQEHGAVSANCAKEMAIAALNKSKANIAIAITGIAGPNGGLDNKPVGLVYIACANSITKQVQIRKFNFSGLRLQVRTSSLEEALNMIERVLA